MEDEKYVYFQDLREKKVTGYSARKQRSHCGKRGRVKFPSDYLTKKELKNMNGECKSYRLNSPMSWKEFLAMPKDLQIAYIKAIKEKYNPTITAIGKMMGVDRPNLSKYLLHLGFEKQTRGAHVWDKEGFAEWCFGTKKTEDCQSVQEKVKEERPDNYVEYTHFELPAKDADDIEVDVSDSNEVISNEDMHLVPDSVMKKLCDEVDKCNANVYAIPETGSLSFTGNAVTILNTLGNLLSYKKVRLSVNWDILED